MLCSDNFQVRVPIQSCIRDKSNPGHSVTVLLAGKIDCTPFVSCKIDDGHAQVVFGGRTSLQTIQEAVAGVARQLVTIRGLIEFIVFLNGASTCEMSNHSSLPTIHLA